MTATADPPAARRPPLTRARVVAAAMAVADEHGLEALSMRRLAQSLGVEAMSLYHHVANKDDLLDGMVDAVFAEIEIPREGEDWEPAVRRRAESARAVLTRHPWAPALLDSRANPGPGTLRHHDAVLGCLRANGFPLPLAGHAVALLDSYVYGFAIQEVGLPFDTEQELGEVAGAVLDALPEGAYPHFRAFAAEHALQPGYDFGGEFGWGLDLILDGLARARRAAEPG